MARLTSTSSAADAVVCCEGLVTRCAQAPCNNGVGSLCSTDGYLLAIAAFDRLVSSISPPPHDHSQQGYHNTKTPKDIASTTS